MVNVLPSDTTPAKRHRAASLESWLGSRPCQSVPATKRAGIRPIAVHNMLHCSAWAVVITIVFRCLRARSYALFLARILLNLGQQANAKFLILFDSCGTRSHQHQETAFGMLRPQAKLGNI